MPYRNGDVPSTALTHTITFGDGAPLLSGVASALRTMQRIGELEHIVVHPVDGYGSGYRSLAEQRVFWDAAHGNRAAAKTANIDPDLHVTVAAVGYSSHGTGSRVDLLFNGHSPDAPALALAKRYGFTREFGTADENHFQHTGPAVGPTTYDKVRINALYLNGLNLGEQTASAHDGERDTTGHTRQNYTWLLQTLAHREGVYPTPQYRIDGLWGPHTAWFEEHLFTRLYA